MSDVEEPQTPRGSIHKQDDLTPCSDTGSPELYKRSCLDHLQITSLQEWFKEQFDILRAYIKTENEELRREISDLCLRLDAKDKTIADLEQNVVLVSNELQQTRASIKLCDNRIWKEKLKNLSSQYSRRNSLRISGLAPFPSDNYRQIVN
jgi:hypothetical protein